MIEKKKSLEFKRPISMTSQIYNDLGRAIANGQLKPGEILKETELQEVFGVSRAPIREAIRLLEADDLIVGNPYKGKMVRPITRKYIQDIIPVIAALEGCAANQATVRITQKEIDKLENINKEMKRAYNLGKFHECAQLNFDFHRVYVTAAKNSAVKRSIRAVKKTIIWLWLTNSYYKQHHLIPLTISEHDSIIQAFREEDSSKTEKVVRKHVFNILDRMLELTAFDSKGNLVIVPLVSRR